MTTDEAKKGLMVVHRDSPIGETHEHFYSVSSVNRVIEELVNKINHTKPNETRMNYARLCEIEPIPITEELLTKIGFVLPEHKEFYIMCRINGKDNSIRLTRYFNLWNAEIFASHPEVVMLEHTIKGLRFVHELQNAYYLVTGKELEIKL